MSTLYELTNDFQELLDLIQQGEFDQATLADTLEGITGEIEIKADGYAKVIKEIEGNVLTIKAEIDRLSGKKSTLDNSIKSLKQSLEMAMRTTGKTKFKTDLFSFNIAKNPASLVITGEVPTEFYIPQPPKIDNAAIKEKLKDGEFLGFAKLEQGESLRIK
jgi:hypothetical protein